ncbi:unnamed protein product [Durusdinium trenchii]|uniref:Aldehyde dehydrogenase domain-containing protein n=1 Tax=Durusdinium trenchii TaxID=1381693 RepID=A0ABP0PDD0_9DINO
MLAWHAMKTTQAVARPLTSLARHGASRRAFAAPGWATVDPETMSAAQPAEGMNLCGGSWSKSKHSQDIVDPLNGDAFLKVPNTGLDEIEPFVQRMASVPRSGLHNPFKNPDRYVMLGEVCGAAAREMFKPEVSDYFCRLIQRVAPKSYAQAGGEIKAVRTWLQDYSGNSVRMLAESQGLPGDHPGQSTVGYRMPQLYVWCRTVITPFNFPLEICSLQTLSAVFMGNQCTTKVDWKVAIVMEQFLRMLHACGLPKADVDYIYCDGPVFNEVLLRGDAKMTLFTGSQRVADKLAVELKGKVKLEDAGFDWKILGPDVMDVDFVAWQADHDAYGFAGQKCSAQSMLFMHERLGQRQVDIVGRLAKLAGQRSLENLTNCPVLTWPTEKILDHMERCLSIPGATLAFGGQPLTGHRIPPQYGAVEPTAVRLPIEALEDSGSFDMATTELFGPFQVLVDYKEGQQSKVIEAINRMPNHLTAGIVSNNPIFINEVLGNSITGTTYAGARARTTGAPVQHWFGPSGDVRAGGIHTKHAIQLCWSSHREVIYDYGPTSQIPPQS